MKPRRIIITTEAESNLTLDDVRGTFGPRGSCSCEYSIGYGRGFVRVKAVRVELAAKARKERLANRRRAAVRHP